MPSEVIFYVGGSAMIDVTCQSANPPSRQQPHWLTAESDMRHDRAAIKASSR